MSKYFLTTSVKISLLTEMVLGSHCHHLTMMKSIFYSRFFILLPWLLIIIIVNNCSVRNTALSYWSLLNRAPQRDTTVTAPPPPLIYAITPTYSRVVQKAELTRLANTFRQVPHFHWIVVEDSENRTQLVSRFLARGPIPYTHLHVLTSRHFKEAGMPRATEQRNAALSWLRAHRTANDSGVVFFADDDNTYSLELFAEIRSTKGVSVWPVGFVAGRRYESPIVENGKVVGWYTGWNPARPFAIDMAGFAVNLRVILAKPQALFKRSHSGMQESDFLKQIAKVEDLEPKANNCTQVLVWHTRTEMVNLNKEPKEHQGSIPIEV